MERDAYRDELSEASSWEEVDPKFRPAVFMFQPTEFRLVPPDRLTTWEKLIVEKVGLRRGGGVAIERCETISGSGGTKGDWDDCDQVC